MSAAERGKRRRPRSKALCRAAKRRRASEAWDSGGWDASPPPRRARGPPAEEGDGATPRERFAAFVRAQGLARDAEDEREMLEILTTPLPVAVRFSRAAAKRLAVAGARRELARLAAAAGADAVQRHRWVDALSVPGVDRKALRTTATPEQKKLHQWLVAQSQKGVVTRQEVVSMVPAALLDVKPGHAVLDLCAAPGSKTTQLLDALTQPAVAGEGADKDLGVVVANDFDPIRARTLARRCEPLRDANAHLLVTCHAAQRFPNTAVVLGAREAGGEGDGSPFPDGAFDRIVCDVPCSGDGTLRKNPEIWSRWHPSMGLSHHRMQLQIAMRGVALLKVGGMMAYSTCSFNPVEDEAVVAELLRRCGGAVELVDASGLLRGLKRRPGLTTWRVCDDMLEFYDDYEASQRGSLLAGGFSRSMWPPAAGSPIASSLSRCLRLLPHLQDTGGFFVALLRKVAPLPDHRGAAAAAAASVPRPVPSAAPAAAPDCSHMDYRTVDKEDARRLRKLLGLKKGPYEAEVAPRLCVRTPSGEMRASVSYLAPAVHQHAVAAPGAGRVHAVRAGLPLLVRFGRRELALTHAGARVLLPYAEAGRCVPLTTTDAARLKKRVGRPVALSELSEDARDTAAALPDGPCFAAASADASQTLAAHRVGGSSKPALLVHKPERLGK